MFEVKTNLNLELVTYNLMHLKLKLTKERLDDFESVVYHSTVYSASNVRINSCSEYELTHSSPLIITFIILGTTI